MQVKKNIPEIYNLIQELSWYFGSYGFSGECCRDLSLVEFMALKKIKESDNITVKEIGKTLGFTKSGASKIVDRLENKEYATREASPADGRVCCVTLTQKGEETLKSIVEEYSAYVQEMLKDFDPVTIRKIKSVLELLTASAQQHRQALNRKA